MSRIVIIIIALSFFTGLANAQILDPELGPRIVKKENTKQRDAVRLTHVREADMIWSTRIWQTLDMRQKMNQPLYFPNVDSVSHGKRSFVQTIFDEVVTNKANVGDKRIRMYEDYQLRDEIDREEVSRWFNPSDSAKILDPINCSTKDSLVDYDFRNIKPAVTKVLLMEDWFFDKQRSVMDVRILALGLEVPLFTMDEIMDPFCTMMYYAGYKNSGATKEVWFFFPELRELMAEVEVYKRFNDAARLSFDDIFLKRMFTSYITKEENVFDRSINEYTKGLDALLEAERIKGEIFDFEQDLWEY